MGSLRAATHSAQIRPAQPVLPCPALAWLVVLVSREEGGGGAGACVCAAMFGKALQYFSQDACSWVQFTLVWLLVRLQQQAMGSLQVGACSLEVSLSLFL